MKNPFVTHRMILENEIVENLSWRKSVSNKEAMAFRERETAKIERMAIDCKLAGDVAKWFQNSDPAIKHMCRHVNGPLLEKLVLQINYRDAKCVDIFRDGAQIIGQLPDMGGERCKSKASLNVSELFETCAARNAKTISELRQDPHADVLSDEIRKDCEEGRMTGLRDIDSQNLRQILLAKRFSVEQTREGEGH